VCGRSHHQSPINLERNRALVDDPQHNFCIDVHWMSYFDSTCEFEELVRQGAFSIERHALKVVQPVQEIEPDVYRSGCRNELGRRFGKIDFSKGFSHWWHLSHIDFHVPSEHTQEGHRYAGELQMYHFYSVSGEFAGVDNQMAAVTTFLEAYDDTPDYDVLNRIICQWRAQEEATRKACGRPSVPDEYPGCYFYTRGRDDNVSPAEGNGGRNLRTAEEPSQKIPRAMSAHDIIMHNHMQSRHNATHKPKVLLMDPEDYKDESDFDWDEFIADMYAQEEQVKQDKINGRHRHLMNYDHVPWFNYFPLIGCKTEYYFRYGGTQTIPPCYAKFVARANRGFTNNWRIMKDPIRVSQRQIDEMHRLIRERIAPPDDPLVACRKDTAAAPDPDDPKKVNVARPLMHYGKAHHKVFCECENWGSKFEEDKQWCRNREGKEARFYDTPYNYDHVGF